MKPHYEWHFMILREPRTGIGELLYGLLDLYCLQYLKRLAERPLVQFHRIKTWQFVCDERESPTYYEQSLLSRSRIASERLV